MVRPISDPTRSLVAPLNSHHSRAIISVLAVDGRDGTAAATMEWMEERAGEGLAQCHIKHTRRNAWNLHHEARQGCAGITGYQDAQGDGADLKT